MLPGSPILLDLNGDGFSLTDLVGRVRFDLNPYGTAEQISWTSSGSDDAWLVLDRNGNGSVDDGTELFGNFTPQPASDSRQGYRALAVLDLNHDGVVDSRDTGFQDLRLWQDRNHDGVSGKDEMSTLTDHGVVGLDVRFTAHRATDAHGNLFRYSAGVYRTPGSHVGSRSFDVFLITRALDDQARKQGAMQGNGAVSIVNVIPDELTCGGGGQDAPICHNVVPPPAIICQGGSAMCFACGTTMQSSSAHCRRVCEGWRQEIGGGCLECDDPYVCGASIEFCSSRMI